jgi:hypothetical protein
MELGSYTVDFVSAVGLQQIRETKPPNQTEANLQSVWNCFPIDAKRSARAKRHQTGTNRNLKGPPLLALAVPTYGFTTFADLGNKA